MHHKTAGTAGEAGLCCRDPAETCPGLGIKALPKNRQESAVAARTIQRDVAGQRPGAVAVAASAVAVLAELHAAAAQTRTATRSPAHA